MTRGTPQLFKAVVTETLHWSIRVTAISRREAEAIVRHHWRDNPQLFRWVGGGDIEHLVVCMRRGWR